MDREPSGPFVRLATLPDPAAADLCAAQLRSAGIATRLHGESLGPYRLTVGKMAATEIWVPEDELDEARALLADGEDEGEPDTAAVSVGPVGRPEYPRIWWSAVALALVALLAWLLVGRLL